MKQRVVVGGVVQKDGKYLFAKQTAEGRFSPDKLIIPGGGIDLGEHPEDALRREFREEVNIELKNIRPCHCDSVVHDNYKGEQYHLVFLQYTADYAGGEPQAMDDIDELVWLTAEEIPHSNQNETTIKLLKHIGLWG